MSITSVNIQLTPNKWGLYSLYAFVNNNNACCCRYSFATDALHLSKHEQRMHAAAAAAALHRSACIEIFLFEKQYLRSSSFSLSLSLPVSLAHTHTSIKSQFSKSTERDLAFLIHSLLRTRRDVDSSAHIIIAPNYCQSAWTKRNFFLGFILSLHSMDNVQLSIYWQMMLYQ
jgi:hypothetical protein